MAKRNKTDTQHRRRRPASGLPAALIVLGVVGLLSLVGNLAPRTPTSDGLRAPELVDVARSHAGYTAVDLSSAAFSRLPSLDDQITAHACLPYTDSSQFAADRRAWRGPDGSAVVVVAVRFISEPAAATYLGDVGECRPSSATPFPVPGLRDALGATGTNRSRPVAVVDLRQGTDALSVQVFDGADPAGVSAAVAWEQVGDLDHGSTYADDQDVHLGDSMGYGGGLVLCAAALWMLSIEVLDSAAERRRRRAPRWGATALSVDVSWLAAGMRKSARRSFAIQLLVVVVLAFAVSLRSVAGVGVGVVCGIVVTIVAVRLWQRRGRRHRPGRRRPNVWAVLSGAVAVGMIGVALWLLDQGTWLLLQGIENLRLRGDTFLPLAFIILSGAVLALSTFPWRLTIRLCRSRPTADLTDQGRELVLYLRSFRDDNLTISVAPYARSSVLERLSGRRGQNFEEILAEEAARRVPVLAIQQPGRLLTPLGFVRETYGDEVWQDEVTDRMRVAAGIVVVLGHGDGLDWEIRTLARLGAWDKAIIVVPPVTTANLLYRWRHLTELCGELGVPAPPLPAEPPVLLALTRDADGRWLHYVGQSADAWHYKAALAAALDGVPGPRAVDESALAH